MTTGRVKPPHRDRLILWIAAPLGLAVFLTTQLGNDAGFTVLPFDHHHVIGQVPALACCCGV
jgi:hypothetical protein